jgi:hypothetical protein
MKLTAPQAWALRKIAEGRATSSANLGWALAERPGYVGRSSFGLKAQGAGRLGGTMMARLERRGLCRTRLSAGGYVTEASITQAGRAALAQASAEKPENSTPTDEEEA